MRFRSWMPRAERGLSPMWMETSAIRRRVKFRSVLLEMAAFR